MRIYRLKEVSYIERCACKWLTRRWVSERSNLVLMNWLALIIIDLTDSTSAANIIMLSKENATDDVFNTFTSPPFFPILFKCIGFSQQAIMVPTRGSTQIISDWACFVERWKILRFGFKSIWKFVSYLVRLL